MTPPERLTITGPEDILGFIPHSLGYWPANSLVAMTMQGKRLGATLRVDLPDSDTDSGLFRFARTVSEYLEADTEADGSLLVVFSNAAWTGSPGFAPAGGSPAAAAGVTRRLLTALEAELELSGRPVRDSWYVGDAYWRSAHCNDPACCPFPGRSLDEIRDSRLNAEMVFRGSSVGEDPAAAGGALPGECRPDAAVMEAEQRWAREFAPLRASRQQFGQLLDTWARVLAAEPGAILSAGLAGYLRASLRVPHWRDAVLVMSAAGRSAAVQGAEDFGIFGPDGGQPAVSPPSGELPAAAPEEDTDGAPAGYGDVLLGLAPLVPCWERIRALERTFQQLGTAGGGEGGAALLTGLGWIEWCRGRGSFAHALLEQAVLAHPGYRLAELLSELVSRGTLCGWAGRRDAAWQKFEPDAA